MNVGPRFIRLPNWPHKSTSSESGCAFVFVCDYFETRELTAPSEVNVLCDRKRNRSTITECRCRWSKKVCKKLLLILYRSLLPRVLSTVRRSAASFVNFSAQRRQSKQASGKKVILKRARKFATHLPFLHTKCNDSMILIVSTAGAPYSTES